MAVSTAIDFESEIRRFFDMFDRLDMEGIRGTFADDVQGIDEISRAWLRGRSTLEIYFAKLEAMELSDVHTSLSDIAVRSWDDVTLVTCMAEQSYRVAGEPMQITAPISMVYRRIHGEWKVELVHAVPLEQRD